MYCLSTSKYYLYIYKLNTAVIFSNLIAVWPAIHHANNDPLWLIFSHPKELPTENQRRYIADNHKYTPGSDYPTHIIHYKYLISYNSCPTIVDVLPDDLIHWNCHTSLHLATSPDDFTCTWVGLSRGNSWAVCSFRGNNRGNRPFHVRRVNILRANSRRLHRMRQRPYGLREQSRSPCDSLNRIPSKNWSFFPFLSHFLSLSAIKPD